MSAHFCISQLTHSLFVVTTISSMVQMPRTLVKECFMKEALRCVTCTPHSATFKWFNPQWEARKRISWNGAWEQTIHRKCPHLCEGIVGLLKDISHASGPPCWKHQHPIKLISIGPGLYFHRRLFENSCLWHGFSH